MDSNDDGELDLAEGSMAIRDYFNLDQGALDRLDQEV